MGRPKALLEWRGRTFTAAVASAFADAGAVPVLIVGREDDDELRSEAARLGAGYVPNRRADEGQLSSLLAGLAVAEAQGVDAVLVCPVDIPAITAATVSALIDTFGRTGAPIVRATYGGRHGHPVLFGRATFAALRDADPSVGARAVVRAHVGVDVEASDDGVLRDVDTPSDYERLDREK